MNCDINRFKKPNIFDNGNMFLWSNEYIAKNVLKKHLDIDIDSGTRKIDTVKNSVNWICNKIESIKTVLDIGCGPGIYSKMFALNEKSVLGIDISRYSIEYAKKNNNLQGLTEYIVQDFRELSFQNNETFDIAIMMYGLYSFYPLKERLSVLKKIYGVLNDNGCVIVEVFTSNHYKGRQESTDWSYVEKDGFWCQKPHVELNAFYRYDCDNTVLIQAGVITDKKRMVWNSWIHMFALDEIIDEFRIAGFTKFDYFGDCCGSQYSQQSDCIVLFAYK